MSDEATKKPPARAMALQLQMDEETAQGRYTNFAMVNHTGAEFILDFIFVQPQQPRGKVLARILTSPVHAKRFAMALSENISRYEQRFGVIPVPPSNPSEPITH